MPSATNSIIYLYKGVPLLKGGTEVLYVYQDNAITQLEPFLHRTFFQYYYVREERQYVRIKVTMPEVEGCNYLAFRNPSNGNKWFFGFIDKLVYINDNTVEIEFTIDVFPTYLGDASLLEKGFLVRNTVANDIRGRYLEPDYVPKTSKYDYISLQNISFNANRAIVYFAVSSDELDDMNIPPLAYPTASGGGLTVYTDVGIKCGVLTKELLDIIQRLNGVIIGCYLCPDIFQQTYEGLSIFPMYRNLGEIGGNGLKDFPDTISHQKIRTGVYNSIVLNTSQGSRVYQLELFTNPSQIRFGVVQLMCPCPSVFVYPKNYKGIADNLAEGLLMKFPAIPISANAVYTYAQRTQDNWAIIQNMASGAFGGAVSGFTYGMTGAGPVGGIGGAVIGGLAGLVTGGGAGVLSLVKNEQMAQFTPPSVTGSGEPVVSVNGDLFVNLFAVRPSQNDLNKIDNFFDYFGYNINEEVNLTGIVTNFNTRDGAYLQTGSPILAGSEVDVELNGRIMSGIKIRRTLSQGA